eukprot:COSAG02_NODE_165_length_32175_cov_86.109490_19_plen_30_part_00
MDWPYLDELSTTKHSPWALTPQGYVEPDL